MELHEKVVLIDDSDAIRMMMELILTSSGRYDVLSYSSGKDAVKILRETMPSFVILDVMMPDIDGLSVLENIKQIPELASVSVFFLTARVSDEAITHYMESGAAGVITKPFNPNTVLEEIETARKTAAKI